ncbi:MAG: 50S ribosomal protein L5 [bacterium]|nr:50S ribosomal protein L5 [bacterium]
MNTKEKQKNAFAKLKDKFGYKNPMQAPRLVKVVINAGTGSFKDKKKNEVVEDRIAKITGQKAAVRGAKKSIASFKVREGDPVGIQVTLRGNRMYGFLDKMISVAFPRTKDFRGVKVSSIDDMGNATFGILEHTVFPETSDEELKDVFGFGVTVVTTAKSKEEAESFFREIGIPFAKESK